MKSFFGLLLGIILLASCARKTQPTVSAPVKKQEPTIVKTEPPVISAPAPVVDSAEEKEETVNAPAMAPMIVIDERGSVITSRDKLPEEIAGKVNYSKISRGYTPAQRKNLIFRFKMVPPRVLFVPEELATKNAKGTYVIFRKKFWYWKKQDGLFHIDETYYL